MSVTLFMVTWREPLTASEALQNVINTKEPVVGRQKFAKVLPTVPGISCWVSARSSRNEVTFVGVTAG